MDCNCAWPCGRNGRLRYFATGAEVLTTYVAMFTGITF